MASIGFCNIRSAPVLCETRISALVESFPDVAFAPFVVILHLNSNRKLLVSVGSACDYLELSEQILERVNGVLDGPPTSLSSGPVGAANEQYESLLGLVAKYPS